MYEACERNNTGKGENNRKQCFFGCKKLSKVTMTAGRFLKSVGKGAFKGVSKKTTITLKGTKKAKTTLKKKLKKIKRRLCKNVEI